MSHSLTAPGDQSGMSSHVTPTASEKMAAAPHKQTPIASGDQFCNNCGQHFMSTLMFENHVLSRTCER